MITEKIQINQDAVLFTYLQDSEISFRLERKRPALIICPGGAYMIHATKEGEPVAMDFLHRGYQCFVLKYTVATDRYHPEKGVNSRARYPLPALELMEVIHLIHANAEKWSIDDAHIFLMGFSAGGHVCATVGTRWKDPALTEKLSFIPEEDELKCSGMILGYPMLADNPEDFHGSDYCNIDHKKMSIMNEVLYGTASPSEADRAGIDLRNFISKDTIPTFLWHTADDPVVDTGISASFVEKLRKHHVNCEYHMFSHGGHGLGLADSLAARDSSEEDKAITLWRILAQYWMEEQMDQGGNV